MHHGRVQAVSGQPGGLRIDVTDVAGKEERLLRSLQECKEGRCSCPTPEYEKVAAMHIAPMEGAIQIELQTKPGSTLEAEAVAKCLDFTIARLAVANPKT